LLWEASNAALQLRRAIGIQPEGKRLLEKHGIAPSTASACWISRGPRLRSLFFLSLFRLHFSAGPGQPIDHRRIKHYVAVLPADYSWVFTILCHQERKRIDE
jgi:hypothetical protein